MNTNFKVVFNKARGALMVANEITSSVQAKGTKTVVAAAVAAVMAGVAGTAMAATDATSLELKEGAVITITADKTGISGGSAVVDGTDAYKDQTFGNGTSLTLTNGKLVLTDASDTWDAINGKSGVIAVTASKDATAASTLTVTKALELDQADISLTVHNGKDSGANATVSGASVTLKSGKLTVNATKAEDANDAGVGSATVSATGDVTLGVATSYKGENESVEVPGSAFDLDIQAKTAITGANVTYNKGAVKNAADLTLNGATSTTVAKEVTFANTGVITLSGETVTFDADYTTAEGNAGKLIVNGTTTTKINGNITTDSIKVGAAETKLSDEKNTVILVNDAAFGVDSKTDTKTLTFADADKVVSISGGVFTSATTAVSASDAQINVTTGSDENNEPVYANVDLGAITIAAGKTSSNSLKITNTGDADGTNAVKAASLTIAAADKENANVGAFTLKGNMEVGALSVAASGTVAVGENADAAKLTLTGASTNAGTVTLGNAGALTIAKDATFDNSATDAFVSGSGAIVVAGTLTNYKAGTTATHGKIAGKTLTVAEGGVVDSNMGVDNYAVDKTTLDGGVFQTSLNALADGTPLGDKTATALQLDKAFVLKGGKFVTRGTESKDIDSFVLTTGGSIDVQEQQDQNFASILVSGGAFKVTDSTVAVADLNVQDGVATVLEDSSLSVGKLTVADGKTVQVDGTLSASAHALGLQVSGQVFAEDKTSGAGSVADHGITLEQTATLVLTDYAETSATVKDVNSLKSLTDKVSGNGVVDIGNVTIMGLISDKNEVKYSDLTSIPGITTNGLKAAKVTGVNTEITHSASWGSIALVDNVPSATVSGSTLTLNGAGQLVTS